jgi:hypothetical protein
MNILPGDRRWVIGVMAETEEREADPDDHYSDSGSAQAE